MNKKINLNLINLIINKKITKMFKNLISHNNNQKHKCWKEKEWKKF
jgi:hypothetical protein